VRNPEELALLTARGSHYGSNTGSNAISYPMYQDFREKNPVFQSMFCRYSTAFRAKTELASGEFVSGNYFPVLGVGAALGRVFTAQDDLHQGGHPLAALSYGYWKTRFGGDPNVLDRKLVLNGYPVTIVGVSQAGLDGVEPGYSLQIRVPMMMKKELTPGPVYSLNDRRGRFVQALGRLKPGMTIEQAKTGLQPLFHQILQMEVQQKEFARATEHTKQQFLKMRMDVLLNHQPRRLCPESVAQRLLARARSSVLPSTARQAKPTARSHIGQPCRGSPARRRQVGQHGHRRRLLGETRRVGRSAHAIRFPGLLRDHDDPDRPRPRFHCARREECAESAIVNRRFAKRYITGARSAAISAWVAIPA
jgi:hypothetical protein